MTEHRDDLDAALRRLRDTVRHRVPVPAGAALRARAEHRLRVRRAATALAAAAAVTAVAVGGVTLLRPTASAPVPPADSPIPPASPTGSPGPSPPVTPSPRPAPQPVQPVDDPIAEVDWRTATITIPPREGCPDGPIDFAAAPGLAATAVGPADDSLPVIMIDATKAGYGDLTGDGRAEAVIEATCAPSEEGLTSGHGGRLLVVAREPGGTLTGLVWTGPPGAAYHSYWISDQRLLIDADPWTARAEDSFVPAPGLALSYRWDGDGLAGWEPAPEYPPMLPRDPDETGPPVRPRGAVAGGLGCPDAELRFTFTRPGFEWGAPTAAGVTYAVLGGPFQQYLFDLDRTGDRLLVTGLACTRADGTTRSGLAVFERAGDGWQGISVLTSPSGDEPGPSGDEPGAWRMEEGRLLVEWRSPGDGEEAPAVAYRWTGTVLEPADGEPTE